MRTYEVEPRTHIIIGFIFVFVCGAFSLGAGALGVIQEDPGAILAFVFSLILFPIALHTMRAVSVIHVTSDGMVVFLRGWGATCVVAHRIHRLEGVLDTSYCKTPEWSLRVEYDQEKHIKLPHFSKVKMFAADLRAHNPVIQMTGVWPMGPP